MLKTIIEELKFSFKVLKYRGENDYGFKIDFSNSKEHNLLDRIKDRTNLSIKDVELKISKGIDYLLKRWNMGNITKNVEVKMTFKKSNFKVIYQLKPESKYLRVKSILSIDMETSRTIKWTLKENFDDIEVKYRELS